MDANRSSRQREQDAKNCFGMEKAIRGAGERESESHTERLSGSLRRGKERTALHLLYQKSGANRSSAKREEEFPTILARYSAGKVKTELNPISKMQGGAITHASYK